MKVDITRMATDIKFAPRSLVLDVQASELEALAAEAEATFAHWATLFGKQVILRNRLMNKTLAINPLDVQLPVPASRVVAGEALVFTSGINNFASAQIKLLEELEKQDKPAVLLELVSGQQVWCNKLASEVMKLSPAELLKLKSYEHWCEGEQDRLWSEVRSGSSIFDFDFQTIHCQSGDRLQMRTSNRILEFEGILYRFSVANEVAVLKTT